MLAYSITIPVPALVLTGSAMLFFGSAMLVFVSRKKEEKKRIQFRQEKEDKKAQELSNELDEITEKIKQEEQAHGKMFDSLPYVWREIFAELKGVRHRPDRRVVLRKWCLEIRDSYQNRNSHVPSHLMMTPRQVDWFMAEFFPDRSASDSLHDYYMVDFIKVPSIKEPESELPKNNSSNDGGEVHTHQYQGLQ